MIDESKMEIKLADANGKAERGIELLVPGKPPYFEAIRIENGWQRRQFAKRAVEHFGLEVQSLRNIDDALVAAALEAATGDKKTIEYPAYTCANLMGTDFETTFLVEKILAEGQPAVLAGPAKSLKTSLLVDLCLSLAQAGHWLGRFRVPEAVTTCLLTGESGMATIQETVKRISTAAGYYPESIRNFLVSDRVPRFDDSRHEAALKALLLEYEIRVLAIDPLFMALAGDSMGNIFIQGESLRRVNELCAESGVSLIICHHTRKQSFKQYSPLELQDVAGAGIGEWCRQWVLVNRRQAYEPGSGHHALWLSVGGSAGHGGCWGIDLDEGTLDDPGGRHWDVSLFNRDEVRRAESDRDDERRQEAVVERVEKAKAAIVAVMAKRRFRDGETMSVLRDSSPLKTGSFKLAFGELLEEGMIEPCEVVKGGRKRPYSGYRLADSTPL